ncbi:MAG: trypsin-like peptidase domain-containing protein [Candidatus Omnitrophica bacterium]|nr:trypsin-like peptidase domain-containing protein [Candidatus Omnitrophota bacterium]
MSDRKANAITDEASNLFSASKESVFQIRVIDLASGEKSSTGSGFYINPDGMVATNYHVVSDYVFKPDRYSITYIDNGKSVELKLLDIDVIHDLALLTSPEKKEIYLKLGESNMPKGERIFSMGNPHDLGMSIIEGTYNGIMQNSTYRKILFSASLNPGMSGGPAINHKGEVVGINVSTQGNDVSFLIPVEFLNELLRRERPSENLSEKNWFALIEKNLVENQTVYINDLLGKDWPKLTLDGYLIPGEISENIKCWGQTQDTEKSKVSMILTKCQSVDWIYLSNEFITFYFSYWFTHNKGKGISTYRLYNHLQENFENSFSFENEDTEASTKFQCSTEFTEIAGESWKTAFCVRQYKQFKYLYDINLVISTVDKPKEGIVGGFLAMGVTQEKSDELIKKFLKEIVWKK